MVSLVAYLACYTYPMSSADVALSSIFCVLASVLALEYGIAFARDIYIEIPSL